MSKLNNELHGISAEIAMCNVYGVPVAYGYRNRGDFRLIHKMEPTMLKFKNNNPDIKVIKHVGSEDDRHDFLLEGGQTLSMKSFKNGITKVAPQIIGQPTSNTYYKYFSDMIEFTQDEWYNKGYEEQSIYFKEFLIRNVEYMLGEYWKGLGTSDFLFLITYAGNEEKDSDYFLVEMAIEPKWSDFEITTTRTLDDWKESNSFRCNNITIGESQVHKNRNCFKFRFDVKGLSKLGLIKMNK